MISSMFFGLLAAISLVLVFVLAAVATYYVTQLRNRTPLPISEEIGIAKRVLRKVRKRQPMSQEELEYARQLVDTRGSLWALAIPGTLFMLGCFYVFGSLEHLHGARPSERTFLGLIPVLTSSNLARGVLATARLKRRLRNIA